jgi:thiopurine S-methyltransferase
MEADFWHEKWKQSEQGFHQSEPNALMVEYFSALGLAPGARVFVPLCGATIDIKWLLDQGHRIAGAELSETAIEQLFALLQLDPEIDRSGPLIRYSAENIDIWVGDIFDLTGDALGPVDASYDRAAVVALPDGMRERYVAHVAEITGRAPQIAITFDYDQAKMAGPPFAVPAGHVERLYTGLYEFRALERRVVQGKLKGQVEAMEIIWLLRAA